MTGPAHAILPGGRLHLQHGPIDLVIGYEGPDRIAAYTAACERFGTILEEIVSELPLLSRHVTDEKPGHTVSRRMWHATRPHTDVFVTPMAAVAGAVADEILATMTTAAPHADKIHVNNGGDIALHLSGNHTTSAAIAAPDNTFLGSVTIRACDPIRGIATSGRGGRSFSLGIADSVTALARSAAEADAAATMIANAVDLPGHPAIARKPACELEPDHELGELEVTIGVGELTSTEIACALDSGLARAADLRERGLVIGAFLSLVGETRILPPDAALN